MPGYIGTRCMICSEKFTAEDDVVVCPECGTPYHRACYEKEGKCVNEALHKCGGEWKPTYDVGGMDGSENQAVVCRFCGNTNPPLTLFCRRCGMPTANIKNDSDRTAQSYRGVNINDDPNAYNRNANGGIRLDPYLINFSDPLCGFSPDEEMDGVKMSELGDFVGSNTHYYLPIFKRFKETKRSLSWNFCSMLFPEFYFAYRKMPLIALAALAVRFISQLPQYIVILSRTEGFGRLSEMAAAVDISGGAFSGFVMLCSAIVYAFMFTVGLFGNKLYYNSAIRKIRKARSSGGNVRDTVIRKGGTSALWLTLFICLTALPPMFIWYANIILNMGMQ